MDGDHDGNPCERQFGSYWSVPVIKLSPFCFLQVDQEETAEWEAFMSKTVAKFELEKETKNSIRYKEYPDEGAAPIDGSLCIQKWFTGSSKSISITIEKKD